MSTTSTGAFDASTKHNTMTHIRELLNCSSVICSYNHTHAYTMYQPLNVKWCYRARCVLYAVLLTKRLNALNIHCFACVFFFFWCARRVNGFSFPFIEVISICWTQFIHWWILFISLILSSACSLCFFSSLHSVHLPTARVYRSSSQAKRSRCHIKQCVCVWVSVSGLSYVYDPFKRPRVPQRLTFGVSLVAPRNTDER